MNTATLQLIIQLQSEAESQLGAIRSQVQGLGQDVDQASGGGGLFSKLFANATNILSSVTLLKGIASGVAGVASSMVSGNAEFERYQTQFTVLLGSADAAKQRLAELADFGAKTPFELPEVVKADKILQSFGLESAEAAAKFGFSAAQIRTIAGDTASGTGASFEEMSLLLGKFSTGATGEAIARMAELGIASRDDLAKMGLEFSKSGQLLSPLPESMQVVLGLMQQKFGGMMDAQSMTFEGMVSNLQDWIGQTKRIVMAPIFDVLKVQLGNLLVFLGSDAVKGAITGFAQALAGGIGAAIQFIAGTVIPLFVTGWGLLEQGLAAAQPYFDAVGASVGAFVAFLTDLGASAMAASEWSSSLAETIATLATEVIAYFTGVQEGSAAFWNIQAAIQAGVQVVLNYAQVWADLATTIASAAAALMNGDIAGAWAALSAGFGQVVTDYQTYALSLAQLLLDTATTIATNVATWGQAFVDWIAPYVGPALAALSAWVAQLWAWVVAQAPAWVAQLAAWGQAFIDWVTPIVGPALGALGGLLGQFLGWIGAQASALLAQLAVWGQAFLDWIPGATVSFLAAWPGMLGAFLDWIAGAVGPLLAQLGLWAIAFVSWIAPQIPGFIIALGGIALALVAFVIETAAVLADKVKVWAVSILGWVATEVLPKLPGILASILVAIQGWITSAQQALATAALGVGKAIIDGIKNGVSAGVGALTDAVKGAAKAALDAAKSLLGIHSPSAVMAEQVGAPIVDGIAMGIKTASPKAVTAMLDLAGKLIDVVAKGVDAFGKIGQLGTIPESAIRTFADTIQLTLNTFSQTVVQWDKASMSAASQFTKKAGDVIEIMSKGIEFFTKLDALRSVPDAQIRNFATMLATAMTALIEISTRDMRIGLMGAVEFAGGAGKMLEVIGKGVEALSKLSGFSAVPVAAFVAFRAALNSAIYTFTQATDHWSTAPIASATAFADSSGKMLDIVGKGADSLQKLADFAGVSSAAFLAFRAALNSAIYTFTQAADHWSAAPITAAVQFAQASSTILDTIGKGVDGITKLGSFQGVPLAAFAAFRTALNSAVYTFTQAAAQFDAAGVAAAATFATGAGKMLGIIGSAVDGLTKLAAFQGVSEDAFITFGAALYATVGQFVEFASEFDATAVEAAGVFAGGAGKATAIIGAAVDGFSKLADFQGVGDAAIAAFAVAIAGTMTRLAAVATLFSTDAIEHAGKFAGAAGAAVNILKNGVEGLLLLNTFTGVSQDAVARFADGVRLAVAAMAALAAQFGADATAAAQSFAKAAGDATDFLKKGVDGFIKLGDLTAIPQAGMALFAQGIVALITTIITLAGTLSTDALAQANQFTNAIDSVITVVLSGLDAMAKLGDKAAGVKAFTDALITQIAALAAALKAQAQPAAVDIGAQIMQGIIVGILSMRSALITSMTSAVMAAVTAARAALGIASPSTVFAEIGQFSALGLAGGMQQALPMVSSAGASLGAAAAGGASGAVASAPSSSSSTNVTIAPGAITLAGVSGGKLSDADLRRLAQLISQEIASQASGRR